MVKAGAKIIRVFINPDTCKHCLSFPYLLGLEDQFSATKDAVVHLDTCTCWIPAM